MKLGEFLEDFAVGEVSKINLGDNDEPGITAYNHKELVKHINRGVYQIHSRLDITFAEMFLQQHDSIQFYRLTPEYAQTNTESTQPIKYIQDSPNNPFDHEILKIISVYNEKSEKVTINDSNDEKSLFTPEHDLLQITTPNSEKTLSLIYRPIPKKLEGSGDGYLDQNIDLPRVFLDALEYYVLSKIVGSREFVDENQDVDRYYIKYENELTKITNENLHISDNTTNIKLNQNGWV